MFTLDLDKWDLDVSNKLGDLLTRENDASVFRTNPCDRIVQGIRSLAVKKILDQYSEQGRIIMKCSDTFNSVPPMSTGVNICRIFVENILQSV